MGNFLVTLLKLILAVILIPFVCVSSHQFLNNLSQYPSGMGKYFISGMVTFLFIFLFLHQFWGIFEFGKKSMQSVFKFAGPYDVFLSRVFPFYLMVSLAALFVLEKLFRITHLTQYFIFFAGFSLALNLLLVSQDMQREESSVLKPNYFFVMVLVFIVNLFVTVVLMDWVLEKHTLFAFFREINRQAADLYEVYSGRLIN